MGGYWRDLHAPHQIPWCGSLYCFELAVELHHCCHYSLHGGYGQGKSGTQGLLHCKSPVISDELSLIARNKQWGSLCTVAFIYAYFLVPETKGLSLEQIDRMLEETTPRTSAQWVPTMTFAAETGVDEKGQLSPEVVEDVMRHGPAV